MTDEDGTVVSTIKYYPFGLTREQSGTLPTDELFTGQQKEPDDVLELYDYNARIYSAAMGRFLSVDPIAGPSQQLNPYSYVTNNPLKYIDPSGMCPPDINCPGDVDVEPVLDPYVEKVAAEDWVNAPPMQPEYDPCEECIAWQAAALAYQQAAELQAWAATAPAGSGPPAASSSSEGGSDLAAEIRGGSYAIAGAIVVGETIDPLPLDPVAWLLGGGVTVAGSLIALCLARCDFSTEGTGESRAPIPVYRVYGGDSTPGARAGVPLTREPCQTTVRKPGCRMATPANTWLREF